MLMGKETRERALADREGAIIDLWGVGVNLGEGVGFLLFVEPEQGAAMCIEAFVKHHEEGTVVEVSERGKGGGE
jgi:hypothetical protein